MTAKSFVAGLDWGQIRDYSFLVVAEVPDGTPKRYAIRHLRRWPLGTSYEVVIADILRLYSKPPLAGSTLVMDRTGVGGGPADALRARGFHGHLVPVHITPGHSISKGKGYLNVPKTTLITSVNLVLGQDRLRVCNKLPLADVFKKEMLNYTVKQSEKGLETYENLDASTHDDGCSALSLMLWHSERQRATWGIRTIHLRYRKYQGRCIIVVGNDQVNQVEDSGFPTLVINISDKPCDPRLPQALKILGWHQMQFADADPIEHDGQWDQALSDSFLSLTQAKELWKWLQQPTWSNAGTPWWTLVITDNGGDDRRAISTAMALADSMNIPRTSIHIHGDDEDCPTDLDGEPENVHIYRTIKHARHSLF